ELASLVGADAGYGLDPPAHQGCKLWFDGTNNRLQCPCHTTSFTTDGRVITHQLPIAPKPLPTLQVRETEGHIEVFAPDRPV
uniref:QcrA and Rieske domain-containing protein n=1 Tax=Mycobacteroides abscessus TaxID=36809 RepID=UPI0011A849BB